MGMAVQCGHRDCYCDYMEIGVRELKARLSEFLERAEAGEVITVTDRGRPKALLAPLPGPTPLERGVADGWITPGDGASPARPRRHRADRAVSDLLDEDRGD